MNYDALIKVVKERRSVRKYKPDDAVSMDKVKLILEAARWAPSGANTQPWEFVVIRDRERVRKVAKVFKDQELRIKQSAPKFPHPSQDYHQDILTYVLVCADERFKAVYPTDEAGSNAILLLSLGACIQNLLLAATALDVSSAWLTPTFDPIADQELRNIVQLPDYISLLTVVPLGYAGGKRRSGIRRPLESMMHEDGFDEGKLRSKDMTVAENWYMHRLEERKAQGPE